MGEKEMKENLQQLFITLSEASKSCEPELLPAITKSMIDIYSIFKTMQSQKKYKVKIINGVVTRICSDD